MGNRDTKYPGRGGTTLSSHLQTKEHHGPVLALGAPGLTLPTTLEHGVLQLHGPWSPCRWASGHCRALLSRQDPFFSRGKGQLRISARVPRVVFAGRAFASFLGVSWSLPFPVSCRGGSERRAPLGWQCSHHPFPPHPPHPPWIFPAKRCPAGLCFGKGAAASHAELPLLGTSPVSHIPRVPGLGEVAAGGDSQPRLSPDRKVTEHRKNAERGTEPAGGLGLLQPAAFAAQPRLELLPRSGICPCSATRTEIPRKLRCWRLTPRGGMGSGGLIIRSSLTGELEAGGSRL